MGQGTSKEMEKEKKRTELYRPPGAALRPCLQITAVFAIVAIIAWTIYSNVLWAMTQNRLDYHRFCIDANEHRILPSRYPVFITPAPISYGYFAIDFSQREARWKLHDVITIAPVNISVSSIDLRGPLNHANPYVAEVALAMGTMKDHRGHSFQGVEDVDGRLATDILNHPYSYYVSFADSNGKEIARDSLDKTCYSNL